MAEALHTAADSGGPGRAPQPGQVPGPRVSLRCACSARGVASCRPQPFQSLTPPGLEHTAHGELHSLVALDYGSTSTTAASKQAGQGGNRSAAARTMQRSKSMAAVAATAALPLGGASVKDSLDVGVVFQVRQNKVYAATEWPESPRNTFTALTTSPVPEMLDGRAAAGTWQRAVRQEGELCGLDQTEASDRAGRGAAARTQAD